MPKRQRRKYLIYKYLSVLVNATGNRDSQNRNFGEFSIEDQGIKMLNYIRLQSMLNS